LQQAQMAAVSALREGYGVSIDLQDGETMIHVW
jgi:hypothetical protein